MTTPLTYYAGHGPMTDWGDYASLADALPVDVAALRDVVQGLLIHVFWADRYGVSLPAERMAELNLRSVADKMPPLLALDPQPLTEARPLERRLVGNCRDFSVLLAAMLRHQGIPARARCGFGTYFLPNHYEDHWVCEYWDADEARWVFVDAQLDAFQLDALHVSFDPLDVPRDQFITGGLAWRLCRSGQADPDAFGIHDMHGLWFVRGDFVRDVAALNKVELLPWDGWGLADAPDDALTPDDLAFLDEVAELTYGDVPEFDAVRSLYESDPRVTVPAAIRSYTDRGVETVALAAK